MLYINKCNRKIVILIIHIFAGTCQCETSYTGADCSVRASDPPYAGKLPQYGLCDIRTMLCNSVIVYGKTFVPSENLTCHLKECEVSFV